MLGIDEGQRFAAARCLDYAKACVLECARANVARRRSVGNVENQADDPLGLDGLRCGEGRALRNFTAEPVESPADSLAAMTKYEQSNLRMLPHAPDRLPAQARRDRQERSC